MKRIKKPVMRNFEKVRFTVHIIFVTVIAFILSEFLNIDAAIDLMIAIYKYSSVPLLYTILFYRKSNPDKDRFAKLIYNLYVKYNGIQYLISIPIVTYIFIAAIRFWSCLIFNDSFGSNQSLIYLIIAWQVYSFTVHPLAYFLGFIGPKSETCLKD